MCGKVINWVCLDCGHKMEDRVGITSLYRVNGDGPFLPMKCDKCGLIHYVREDGKVCHREESSEAVFESVCCY